MGKKDRLIKDNNVVFESGKLKISEQEIVVNDYDMINMVGNGANAIVLEGQGKIAKEKVAIKIWIPTGENDRLMEIQSRNEITKLAKLTTSVYSPYLVQYYTSGTVKEYSYCIMEYLDTSNYKTLRYKLDLPMEAIDLSDRYNILMQIASGLRFAHENKIFHGDLHLDNILVDRENNVKIIDFGTSFKNKDYSKERDNKMMLQACKDILGEYYIQSLVLISDDQLRTLPQNCTRLILKALTKIIVLLDHWKYGMVDTIVEDIALFATLVPFFNIRGIVDILFSENEDEEYKKIFKEKIITELFSGTYQDDIEYEELDILYLAHQKKFIEHCDNDVRESSIYREVHQAKIFNDNLYSENYGDDEISSDKKEIAKLIQ